MKVPPMNPTDEERKWAAQEAAKLARLPLDEEAIATMLLASRHCGHAAGFAAALAVLTSDEVRERVAAAMGSKRSGDLIHDMAGGILHAAASALADSADDTK